MSNKIAMHNKHIIQILLASVFVCSVQAQAVSSFIKVPSFIVNSGKQPQNNDYKSFSSQKLLNNPAALHALINTAIVKKDYQTLRAKLYLYKRLSNSSPVLVAHANAIIAQSSGNYKKAIVGYRKILAHHPENTAVRKDLAIALLQSGKRISAKNEFMRLRNSKITAQDKKIIERTIMQIKRDESFKTSLRFKVTDQTFTTPPKYVGSPKSMLPITIEAKGIRGTFGVSKRKNMGAAFYAKAVLSAQQDYYFTHDNYNNLTTRVGLGLGYEKINYGIELQPYLQNHFVQLNNNFTQAGVLTTLEYEITPQFVINNELDIAHKTHKHIGFMDGLRTFAGVATTYKPNTRQYVTLGVNDARTYTQQNEYTFFKHGVFARWGQEYPIGFASKLTLAYHKKNYQGADIQGIQRSDDMYSTNLSLWNKYIRLGTVLPILQFSWLNTQSNNASYTGISKGAKVNFEKDF